jgi:hypothetical protein
VWRPVQREGQHLARRRARASGVMSSAGPLVDLPQADSTLTVVFKRRSPYRSLHVAKAVSTPPTCGKRCLGPIHDFL